MNDTCKNCRNIEHGQIIYTDGKNNCRDCGRNLFEPVPTMNWIDEIVIRTHTKWLGKAETSNIRGSELTVLPYGYLSNAVRSVAQEAHTKGTEEERKRMLEWIDRYIANNPVRKCADCNAYHLHLTTFADLINFINKS